ncbi:hypothetical protein JA9_000587 [Meyerozyma sp. JA9]|nr:hypothetical protein JA9_000587 [Meyerozyma sp. JA9]
MVHEVDIAEIPLKRSEETFVDEPKSLVDVNDMELSFDLEHKVKNINSLHVFHAIVILRNTVEVIIRLQEDPQRFQHFRNSQLALLGIHIDDSGVPYIADSNSNNCNNTPDITTPPHSPPLKVAKIAKEDPSSYHLKDATPESTESPGDGESVEAPTSSYIAIELLLKEDIPDVTEPITGCSSKRIYREMQTTRKQKAAAQYSHLLKAFNLASEPTISVESFLMRINTYSSSTSVSVYIHAAFLIYKLAVIMDVLPLSMFNVHRVILSSIRCSTKKLEDVYQSQTNYATVVGVSKKDLFKLEMGFLFLCNFQLVVGEQILNDFVKSAYVNLLHTNANE